MVQSLLLVIAAETACTRPPMTALLVLRIEHAQPVSMHAMEPACPDRLTKRMLQMVDEAGGDLQGALQLFEERRHPETLALHQMDMLTDAW